MQRDGRSFGGPLASIRLRANGLDHNRFGFAVGKRVGKAVTRNSVKRRLRAILAGLPLRQGWDVVVSARAPAAAVDYHELTRALAGLLRRARLLEGDGTVDRPRGPRDGTTA